MKSKGSILSVMVALMVGMSLVAGRSEPKFDSDPLKENQSEPETVKPAQPAPTMGETPKTTTKATPKFPDTGSNDVTPTKVIASSVAPADSELSANLLRNGDEILVNFSDTPTPMLPLSVTVKDDGTITIIYNQSFQAAGRTLGALQNDIHDRYVPTYFKFLTVNLTTQRRFFTVGGEVKAPNRYEYSGKMTVLGGIDTSGGFTDFSKKTRVQVTRSNGKKITVNAVKALENPELNIEIFPGDRIDVPKRSL